MNLDDNSISMRMKAIPLWRRDGEAVIREFQFENFAGALEFVNRVGAIAEAADHHPDILIHGWNRVRLTLTTHSSGGLTVRDFDLAGSIDRLLQS